MHVHGGDGVQARASGRRRPGTSTAVDNMER